MAELPKNLLQENKTQTPQNNEKYPQVDRRKKSDRRKFAFLSGQNRRDGKGRRADDRS
jgi:hypothetical protein